MRYISVLGSSELAEWKVCMQNQGICTRQQIVLCNCVAKLSTLKNHPFYRTVHQPSLQRRFALNLKTNWSAGIRFKELMNALQISTPPVIPFKIRTMPLWSIRNPHCSTHLCGIPKACTPPDTFHRVCTQVVHTHQPDYTVVLQMYPWQTDQWVVHSF